MDQKEIKKLKIYNLAKDLLNEIDKFEHGYEMGTSLLYIDFKHHLHNFLNQI